MSARPTRRSRAALALAVFMASVAGCASTTEEPSRAPPRDDVERAAEFFARVISGEPRSATAIGFQPLAARTLRGLEDRVNEDTFSALAASVDHALGRTLDAFSRVASASVVQVEVRPAVAYATVRLASSDVLDYRTFAFVEREGRVALAEIQEWGTCERLSQRLRDAVLHVAAEELPELRANLSRTDRTRFEARGALARLEAIAAVGSDATEALALRATLPLMLRSEPHVLTCIARALPATERVALSSVLSEMTSLAPIFPELLLARALVLEAWPGRDREALAAVDELDAAVGGDPGLDALRAAVHLRSKRVDEARALGAKLLSGKGTAGALPFAIRVAREEKQAKLADEWEAALARTRR